MSSLTLLNQIIHLSCAIVKWEQLLAGVDRRDVPYCRLCEIYNTEETPTNAKGEGWDCNGCPIYEDTGRIYCEGTPYADWWNYITDVEAGRIERIDMIYKTLILNELSYLRKLLSNLIGEQDRV